jgi:hypothetical protein
MKITCFIKNRKISFLVSLLLCLFSNSSFAQEKLPVENKSYYSVVYSSLDYAKRNKKLENIVCEISEERVYSIQKDSIVFAFTNGNATINDEFDDVFYPITSYNIGLNTTLYLLEDAEKKLFECIVKTSNEKVMMSSYAMSTDREKYNSLISQLDSINNADKEAFVVNSRGIYYHSLYSRIAFENYSKLPRFTFEMYEDIKDDLSNVIPNNEILENYFIDNGLNPFHGKSYYRSLLKQEKLDKSFSPNKFFNRLYNIFIFLILISVLWSLYRFYRYFKHKKSSIEPKIEIPAIWWIKTFRVLAMVGFVFGGILVGVKASMPIGHMLGYTGGNSIGILIVAVFSTPIGGILGILLGLFISRKTKLV